MDRQEYYLHRSSWVPVYLKLKCTTNPQEMFLQTSQLAGFSRSKERDKNHRPALHTEQQKWLSEQFNDSTWSILKNLQSKQASKERKKNKFHNPFIGSHFSMGNYSLPGAAGGAAILQSRRDGRRVTSRGHKGESSITWQMLCETKRLSNSLADTELPFQGIVSGKGQKEIDLPTTAMFPAGRNMDPNHYYVFVCITMELEGSTWGQGKET